METNTPLSQEERSMRGIKKCAEWLTYCLSIGWPKKDLNGLENIWWKHHDRFGNLKFDANGK